MLSLAKSFSELGYDVQVLQDHCYLKEESFKTKSFRYPKIFRSYAKKFFLKLNGNVNDLIICDTWKSLKAIPRKFKNVAVLAHGQEYLKLKSKKNQIEKSLLKTNYLIASSSYTLNLIKKNWNLSKINSEIIYPTYNIKSITYDGNKQKNKEDLRFVSICRIEKRKGLLESIRALKIVDNMGYKFIWDIIGDGPQLNILKRESFKLNLQNKINFHGIMNNENKKDNFLKNSDIFLMPSFHVDFSIEGFGISYIEAARFGIPSIAGECGGAPEAVINKKTGWCVNPLNQEFLVETLVESITSMNTRQKYGLEASKRFQNELTGEKVTNKLIKFLLG